MGDAVLIAFTTRHGSTEEVALLLAARLRESGLKVDVARVAQARDPAGYHGIVIGAPLQMFRWHKEALDFVQRNQQALVRKPVAVFAVGPVTPEKKEWDEALAQLRKELAQFPWFLPFETRVFGGRFDPRDLRFPWTLLPGMKKWPASDVRDPKAVENWATELAARFLAGES